MTLTPAELSYAQRKAKLTAGILGVLGDTLQVGWLDALTALAWVVMRRDDQQLPYQVVETMSVRELQAVLGLDEDADEDRDDDAEGRDAPTG